MTDILLVKTTSLGDVIHNLPVVSDILRANPAARIDWVVEESFADIPRLHPGVRSVLTVAVRRWRSRPFARCTWRDMARARQALGLEQYDYIIDTQGLLKSALIASFANGSRYGYAAEVAREPLAARFYDHHFAIPRNLHAVERNRWLAAAALGYPLDLDLEYGIRAQPVPVPHSPYAVLLTATSRDDKLWPEADWIALGRWLNARGIACALPAGNARERERARHIADGLELAWVAPPSRIGELAGLLAGARLIVGVDTGLTHLAAALARPTLALYCSSDPLLVGVHAGDVAINLGGPGATPACSVVIDRADQLLAPSAAEPDSA